MEENAFLSDVLEVVSKTKNIRFFDVVVVDDSGRSIPINTMEAAFVYSNLLVRFLKMNFKRQKVFVRVYGLVLD